MTSFACPLQVLGMSVAQNQRPGEWPDAVSAVVALSLLLRSLFVVRAVVVLPVSVAPVLVVLSLSEPREFVVPRLSKSGPC